MLPNFIAKFTVERHACLGRGDHLAIESFATLRQGLIDRVSREAAALFAEPIVSSQGDVMTIAYYGEPEGEAVPLDRLDVAARAVVADRLRSRLQALAPLLSSDLGRLLADALYVSAAEDILAVGTEPLLVRWGVLPDGVVPADRPRLEAHFAATLGRYAPFGAPDIAPEARVGRAPSPVSAAAAATRPTTAGVATARWPRETKGLLIATAVAALASLLLALPGVLATPVAGQGDDGGLLAAARQVTRAMQDKVDEAKRALQGVQCNPDGTIRPGPGNGQQGQLPPAPIPVTPAATGASGDMALVARRATESVVLLLNCVDRATWNEKRKAEPDKGEPIACPAAPSAGSAAQPAEDLVLDSSGSGFFIAPKLVVTNSHVVEGSKRMLASSAFLGRVVSGKVEAATVKTEIEDADFAVVSLDTDKSPPPVALATSVARLQNVVAAGFPGLLMSSEQIEQLIKGDFGAMPELTTFPGFVTLTKNAGGAVPLIFSSATIGHGNSGGPLLDLCARAIGVNTIGGAGQGDEAGYRINIAESTTALLAFLDQHNIAHQAATDACSPAPQAANGTPPPAGTPPAAGATAPAPGGTPPAAGAAPNSGTPPAPGGTAPAPRTVPEGATGPSPAPPGATPNSGR